MNAPNRTSTGAIVRPERINPVHAGGGSLSTHLAARPRSLVSRAAAARGSSSRARAGVLFVLVLAVLTSACASVAPGQDPYLVHAQQALRGADVIYRGVMEWYFTPGVAASLSPQVKAAAEKVRTGYDPAYKALDAAIDAYRAGKRKDVGAELKALADLLNAVSSFAGQARVPEVL